VRRTNHSSDGSEEKSPSRTRRVVFWLVYVLLLVLVVTLLVFPYDRVVEGLVVRVAARNGLGLEFESFDYRFPARIVCRGMTVTPRVGGRDADGIYWPEFECRTAFRPLLKGTVDVMHLSGRVETGDESEGEYLIAGSFVVPAAQSGPSPSGQILHIRRLALEGQGVNLTLRGDVNITGSPRGIDLSVDIERLDRMTSVDKRLSMLLMALKFAMGADEPPLVITIRGQGANLDFEKKAGSAAVRRDMLWAECQLYIPV